MPTKVHPGAALGPITPRLQNCAKFLYSPQTPLQAAVGFGGKNKFGAILKSAGAYSGPSGLRSPQTNSWLCL